jgi:hypothetical protein
MEWPMVPVSRRILMQAIVAGAFGAPSSTEPFAIPRITSPIVIDGRLDEDAWQRIAPLAMVGFAPNAGAEPSERTVIRIAYDDRYLYVAADMGIADGREPTVNTFTRDRWANDDLLEVVIDSYNDNETAAIFGVNPAGVRIDAQVTNDAEPTFGFPVDPSWNAFWDAATRRWAGGWSVEMRIPFASLRFQPQDGVVTMGIIVSRFIARSNETVTFPAIDPRWRLGYNKPSQARDIVLEGIEPTRPVHVSPYLLAGIQRSTRLDANTRPETIDRSMREAGADVRFAPTNNLNVDLSLNTDFAQVEADDQLVNLSRFDLFLPEKRQFFQERAGLFEFRTNRINRLFYSRRIGIVGSERARIVGGGRVVGRFGGWDVGALGMRTAGTAGSPAETFVVGRVRMRALSEFSHLGAMVTSRAGGGAANLAVGLDGTFRLDSRRYVSANWAETLDNGVRSTGAMAGSISIEDPNRDGLGYRVAVSHVGAGFDPQVGFVQRRDYRDIDAQFSWGIRAAQESRLVRWGPLAEGSYLVRNTTGALETAQGSLGGEAEFKNGAMVRGGVAHTVEHLDAPFMLGSDATIPDGRHAFTWARLFTTTPPAPSFGASLFARAGRHYDGSILSATLSPRWRLAPYLELRSDLEGFSIRLPARGEVFEGAVIRMRGQLSLSTALSVDLLLQHASTQRQSSGNVRLHYFIREGTSLWIALNGVSAFEPFDVDRTVRTGDRTLVVKYIHTFGPS